jgi:hypothetical protein
MIRLWGWRVHSRWGFSLRKSKRFLYVSMVIGGGECEIEMHDDTIRTIVGRI